MKKILFHYTPGELSQDYNIVLVFKPPTKQRLGDGCSIVAWRVMTFLSKVGKARNRVLVEYSPSLCFGVDELRHGNIVCTTSDICVAKGESVSLYERAGVYIWDDPVPSTMSSKALLPPKAYNRTSERRWISIGTMDSAGQAPTFLWRVAPTLGVEAAFDSTLMAFISDQYMEHDIITEDISRDVFWTMDLDELPSISNFWFHETPQGQPIMTDFHHIKVEALATSL